METDLRTYLQAIGDPDYRNVEPGLQILDEYLMRYKDRSDPVEAIDQEYVAFMAELYSQGILLPQEVGPVMDDLDAIFAGEYSKVDESALGSSEQLDAFAGPWAKTASQGKLIKAQQMQMRRADPVYIWKTTGWFQGLDGRWRFEIDDSMSKLLKSNEEMKSARRNMPLRALFYNPGVFEAYPQLAEQELVLDHNMPAGEGAKSATQIILGTKGLNEKNRDKVRPADMPMVSPFGGTA